MDGLPLVITMSGELQGIPNPWDGDSWSNWDPDPERAFREHDPTLEPFASMSKEELLECMRDAHGGREWEFLREFLLDKCAEDEFEVARFLSTLQVYTELGYEEFCLISEAAGQATRLRPSAPPQPQALQVNEERPGPLEALTQ